MLFLKPSKELEPRQVAVKIKVAHYRFSMLPSPFARRNVGFATCAVRQQRSATTLIVAECRANQK